MSLAALGAAVVAQHILADDRIILPESLRAERGLPSPLKTNQHDYLQHRGAKSTGGRRGVSTPAALPCPYRLSGSGSLNPISQQSSPQRVRVKARALRCVLAPSHR